MQGPTLTFLADGFRELQRAVRHHAKPRRRLPQLLVATLIAALVLVSLPTSQRLSPPAQAQIVVIPPRICDPNNPGAANQIIQKCALGESGEYTLENSVINDLLSSHKLPLSDRSRLLGWERDAIRAGMYAKLITDIQNGVTEAAPMPTLRALVKARRVLAATKALDEYNRWAANCPYIPPGPFFTYTETQCTGLAGLFGRNAPAFEEFQAYGAYLANQDIQNNAAMQESAKNMALGIGLLGGLTAAGVATGVLVGTGAAIGALSTALFPFSGSAFSFIGVTALAAPVAAILFAVIVGVIRGLQVAGQDEIPGKLQQAKTDAMNQTIDLAQLITTDNGRREVLNEFLQATFPDFPATSGVPTASAADPQFEIKPKGGSFTTTASLQYKDWDGATHTLRLNGGWFVDRKGSGAERLALSVKFLNGQGRQRQVSRIGSQFLVTDISDDKASPVKDLEFEYQNQSGNSYVARLVNTAPTLATFNLTRRQEQPAPTTDFFGNPTTYNVAQIAMIGDTQDSVGLLQLTVPTSNNGITISEIKVQSDGKVMARVQPSCTATNASFTVQVMDTAGVTTTQTLNVTVTPNAAPVLAYAPTQTVTVGTSFTVLPTAGPSDDGGNVHKWDTVDPNPFGLGTPTITPLNPTAPTFTGTVTHTTSYGNIIYITPAGLLDIRNAGPAGSYRVDLPMMDACGLTTVGTFTLNVTCVPIIWSHSLTNPTCPGTSNGQITINANGGSGALKYSKDNGQTFQDSNIFNGLSAGSYKLVVKDTSGCATESRTVSLADPIAVTFTTTPVNPTCNGARNGRITVNASGGTNSFTYSLNGGSFVSSNVFSGLTAGSYSIAVKDSNGCAAAAQSVTLTQPTALGLTPTGLPTAQAGYAFAQSFTASGGTGTKTVSLAGSLPSGVSFTSAANGGTLAGTPLQTGSFPLTLTVTDQNQCSVTQSLTLMVVCPTLTLAPTNLANGTGGVAYTQTLTATPATGSYSFAVNSGALPPGLTLAPSGALTGTPTLAGNYTFEVSATGFGGCTAKRQYQIQIFCPTLTISPITLPQGTVGTGYNQAVSATPSGSYLYAVTSGALPNGLSLNTATGALTGSPTASGTFSFTLTATAFGSCTGSRSYSLTILCPPLTLAPTTLLGAQMGTAYQQTVSVNPAGSYSYSVLTGNIPPGFSLNAATGALSGTATATGTYSFTLLALSASGCSVTQAYSIAVGCATITLTPASLPDGTAGTAYNQTFSATPTGNYNFTRTSGTLPPGLNLSATGILSGTPTTQGSYSFTVQASNSMGCTGFRTYSVLITANCSTITLPALPNGTVGANYNGNLAGTLPSGSYTFTLASGTLPPGLTLDSLFAALRGKPTTAGTYQFSLQATRSNGCTGTQAYTVVIGGGSGSLAKRNDFDGDGKSDLVLRQGDYWRLTLSATRQTEELHFGQPSDLAALGDYDGDGRTDLATYNAAKRLWQLRLSSTHETVEQVFAVPWGTTGLPVAADYDGDGRTDLALWEPATAHWYIQRSSDGKQLSGQFGEAGDVPVPADYDGDGRADLAVFAADTACWRIQQSSNGVELKRQFGQPQDVPLTGDFDGDGRADLGIWRAAEAALYLEQSHTQQLRRVTVKLTSPADGLLVGDYDGDGQWEAAHWQAVTGKWDLLLQRVPAPAGTPHP